MATFKTDVVNINQFFEGHGGYVQVRKATYTVAAALALNDVIEMIPVQPGEQVVDMWLIASDLDSSATPAIVLDVGDGADADRYIDGSTIGQAGGVARLASGIAATAAAATAFDKVFTAADTLDVTVATGPATGATTGTITMIALIVGS